MTTYYIEELHSQSNQFLGFSKIKKATKKSDLPSNYVEIDMNNINYKSYIESPKSYYLSGKTLVKTLYEKK